jgi:hypothetical protein
VLTPDKSPYLPVLEGRSGVRRLQTQRIEGDTVVGNDNRQLLVPLFHSNVNLMLVFIAEGV